MPTGGHIGNSGASGGGGGAPTAAVYLTGAAHADLTAEVVHEPFLGRLARNSATEIGLSGYGGTYVVVNGKGVDISTALTLLTTTNLLSATGTDSGAAMGASTLYYIYVSNADATFRPSALGASATAPTAYKGSRYLAASGNGANWRFAGYVRTNASTQFVDTAQDRLVINYYNKRKLQVFANPGYVDDNLTTTFTGPGTTWAQMNSGTGSRITMISNGEDATILLASVGLAANNNANSGMSIGIGVDSATSATAQANIQGQGGGYGQGSVGWSQVLPEGYHTLDVLGKLESGTGWNVYADFARDGSTADPRGCMISGIVMG